jgi:hypothetical protein
MGPMGLKWVSSKIENKRESFFRIASLVSLIRLDFFDLFDLEISH